jgi:hypothetical protein
MPEEFEERWQPRDAIQVYPTDLDGNNVDDFVVVIKASFFEGPSKIYWLYGKPGDYQLTELPVDNQDMSPSIEVREFMDLNKDSIPELVYITSRSGASDTFADIFILSWQNGQFKNMVIGDNGTQNGGWKVEDTDQDGMYELIKQQGGPGSLGFCCNLAYEIDYRLSGNEFVPVQQKPGDAFGVEENPNWQLAKMMQHTGHYTKAVEYLEGLLTNLQNDPYRQEVIPYVYFQLGMTYLVMDEPVAAQETWQALAQNNPDHPVTLDVQDMQPLLHSRDDIWQACAWLRQNQRAWPLPEDEQQILKREAFYDQWQDLCAPMFLLNQWEWSQAKPIAAQLAARTLTWQSLSDIFDLNKDGLPDPIGQIQAGNWRKQVWVFLTRPDGSYQPFYAEQPYPPEAISIWNKWGYDSSPWHLDNDDFEVILTDQNRDDNPEIFYIRSDGAYTLQTEWTGRRFEVPGHKIKPENLTVPDFGDELSYTNILKTLFYDQDFEKTLKLLDKYDPAADPSVDYFNNVRWIQAGSLFLRGLACSYRGDVESANQFFAIVVQNFADTSWVDLAREKWVQ